MRDGLRFDRGEDAREGILPPPPPSGAEVLLGVDLTLPADPARPLAGRIGRAVRSHAAGFLMLAADVLVIGLILIPQSVQSVLFVVLLVLGNTQGHMYRSRFTLSVLNDLPTLVSRFLMAFVLAEILSLPFPKLAINITLWWWAAALAALIVERTLVYAFIRAMRRRRLLGKTTLIVGCRENGLRLARTISTDRSLGLAMAGFIDRPPPGVAADLEWPLVAPVSQMIPAIERYRASVVIVSYTYAQLPSVLEVIKAADRLSASIYVVPRLEEVTPVRWTEGVIGDVPLTHLPRPAFRSPLWRVKRLVDIFASLSVIVLLSPLLALLALLDRIVDGPGVIFKQERIGMDGRPFEVYKFRSLRPASTAESDTTWNVKHDDRLSWYGAFLRRSSLDELPQLFNILRGDMSMVGPRPERPHFVEQFAELYPFYGSRHRVPCGLTGWAQVNGLRGDTSISARARYDNFYIENWSLWLDAKIILRTITSLMKASG